MVTSRAVVGSSAINISNFCAVATAMNRFLKAIHVAELPLNTGYARTSGFTVVLIDVVVVTERRVSAVGLVFVGKGDVTSVGSVVSSVRGLRRLVPVGENVGGSGRVLGELIDLSVSVCRNSSHTSSVKYSGSGSLISLLRYSSKYHLQNN